MLACPYSTMPRPTVPCPTANCCPRTKLVPCVANDLFNESPLPVDGRDGNLVGKGLWVITVISRCRNRRVFFLLLSPFPRQTADLNSLQG